MNNPDEFAEIEGLGEAGKRALAERRAELAISRFSRVLIFTQIPDPETATRLLGQMAIVPNSD